MVKRNDGFTLIELMIVIAIIAIIAAIAIPNLLSARLSANESNAISTLRNMVTSQAQFQSASNIDQNTNGTGEYGSFGEMSGQTNLMRGGVGLAQPLNPPILPATFQQISAAGHCTKSGYLFVMFLPGVGLAPQGLKDNAGGGANAAVDPTNCEAMWCCYGWPTDLNTTGNRAFFVNQRGEILQTKMNVLPYSGIPGQPAFSAAYTAVDMASPIALPPAVATDGNSWTPLG